MLIHGHDGPTVPGEPLTARPGFWADHLLPLCHRPAEPEWFGGDGADADAVAEVLFDEQAWPALRVPFRDGHTAVLVHRNLPGDAGRDLLLTHPDRSRPEPVLLDDGCATGPGLSWAELDAIASATAQAAEGLHDPDARLLLLLPALHGHRIPPGAAARIAAALLAVGAPPATVPAAVSELLHGLGSGPDHEPCAPSPLSGGLPGPGTCGLPHALGLDRARSDRLARALEAPACGC
ncbi:hypothetical protein [Streptomyces sp. NRRL B-24484]|uniref:hypothetical protein n=1 Tax=Streptomyces sp. NRRL B-24484 TaxID=1463833 RepID=UPI0004C05DB6|nr:hypothetical protein [Streptomyces sp. NRRL B-24484]